MYDVNHTFWIFKKRLFIDCSKNEAERSTPWYVKINSNKTHTISKCTKEGKGRLILRL